MDETTNPYPEDLSALNAEDLQAAEDRARAESADLTAIDPAEMTDEQVAQLEFLADFIDAVGQQQTANEQVAAERTQRAQRAAERLNPPTDTEATPEDEPEPEADPETPDETPAPEDAPAEVTDEAPVAVAASAAPRRSTSTVRRMRQPSNPAPVAVSQTEGYMASTAAADIRLPDTHEVVNAGADLGSIGGAVGAFQGTLERFPKIAQPGAYDRKHVAVIHRNHKADADGLWYGNPDYADTQSLLKAAADEKRLPGGSLVASKMSQQRALVASAGDYETARVAAGGWCAPSENLYGLCADETLDGILDLPTIGVDRGGINYTPGPDFQDIYTGAGFVQTEAEAIAGDTKACTEVDCPDFTEVRLDAGGICVKSPLLTRAAYPELNVPER